MTRPQIIRADSIDLQDQTSPSAQDHTRQPTNPAPLGEGPPAPHQAEALREVAVEVAEQSQRSPTVAKEWSKAEAQQPQQSADGLAAGITSTLTGANLQQQDDLAVAQNGGLGVDEADIAEAEPEDGLDDDMMDKISSSPSIDDGGCFLPLLWPQRGDSLSHDAPLRSPSFPQACYESSSPFVETPDHFPLSPPPTAIDKDEGQGLQAKRIHRHRHPLGEYLDGTGSESSYENQTAESAPLPTGPGSRRVESYNHDLDYFNDGLLAGHLTLLGDDTEPDARDAIGNPSDRSPDQSDPENDEPGITVPYESSEDEDDDYEIPYSADSRFVDSGWGGECLQELEDIDFEFVYALHTFVATVEGQANATKGDTMVLLDDSNSYWWLVRVVKDSSIGYLPAEHIETPTERLARLNKHRNIDLTSTMLGDQEVKQKNPLKKAIRRRNAKTVTFTAPTYVEASDIDYSSEEEEDGEFFGQNGQSHINGEHQIHGAEEEEIDRVEPLKTRTEVREVRPESADPDTGRDSASKHSFEATRSSDEMYEGKAESKSRNGTVRNTDSFFKDDSVETRKISLTPNLLRDDSSTSTRASNESKELKQRVSLDKLEKDSPDRSKDKKEKRDKKEKEKKPGMLSGLFKRKEKKIKASSIDEEIDDFSGNRSHENHRSSSPDKHPEDAAPVEAALVSPTLEKQSRKLHKPSRTEISPTQKQALSKDASVAEPMRATAPARAQPAESAPAPSLRLVKSEPSSEDLVRPAIASPEDGRDRSNSIISRGQAALASPKEHKSGGTISKILRSASSSNSEPRPVKARKAKSRVELDDFDTSNEDSPTEEATSGPRHPSQRPVPGSFPDSYDAASAPERHPPPGERLSESPVPVSPLTPSHSHPPALMIDTSSQEDPPSPVSSPSPELGAGDDGREKKGVGSSTASTSSAAWSDTHLRTFFDDDAEIRDLLVVVYDKSGVVPAGPDHPITGALFKEENAKLADITNRLDGMLGDWLARKMRTPSSR